MRDPKSWINFGEQDTLRVSAAVSTPTEWLDLNDGVRYTLEASTLNDRSVTHRRREITSPHVPGNWLISAQPDNVTENVVVWVNEFDHFALWKAVDALEVAFTQPQFIMRWQVDQHEWAWSCQLADYQITTDQPLMHATMAKFTVRVPRHPQVVHALAGLLPKVPGGRAYT